MNFTNKVINVHSVNTIHYTEKEKMIAEIIQYSRFYDEEDIDQLKCRSKKSIALIYHMCVNPFVTNWRKI